MAQTIQIKRSSTTTAPSSLASGELAYSTKTGVQKLYYGDGTDVLAIGGKSYTDKLDGIDDNANNYVLPLASTTTRGGVKLFNDTDVTESGVNVVSTTAGKFYGIQLTENNKMVVNVPWTDTTYSLPIATSSALGGIKIGTGLTIDSSTGVVTADEVTTSAVSSAGALMKTGGSMTGDINFSTTSKAIFGGDSSTANRMEIGYNSSGSGVIKETGTGSLTILGQSLFLTADDSDDGINIQLIGGTTELVTKIISDGADVVKVSPSGFELGALGTTVDIIRDEDDMTSDDDNALATQQSIKKYVDDNTATAAVADSGTSLATGDQIHAFVTGQGYITSETFGSSNAGNFTFSGDTVSTSGATMTLDPSTAGTGGTVVIQGGLEVKGTTTTIDSTIISLQDPFIELNKGYSGSSPPTSGTYGFTINRGTGGDNIDFFYNEAVDQATPGTGFMYNDTEATTHKVLSDTNFETLVTSLDGGTF